MLNLGENLKRKLSNLNFKIYLKLRNSGVLLFLSLFKDLLLLPIFLPFYLIRSIFKSIYNCIDNKIFHKDYYWDYIMVMAPIAFGKTRYAKLILEYVEDKFEILDSDELRKNEIPTYEGKFYSKEYSIRIKNKMLTEAKRMREEGITPVLVSTFNTKEKRAFLKELKSRNPLKITRLLCYDLFRKSTLEEAIERRKSQNVLQGETKDEEIIRKYYNEREPFEEDEFPFKVSIMRLRDPGVGARSLFSYDFL